MLYRVFTEDKNRRGIKRICNRLFNGYTMYPAQGVWKGVPEKSLCIEVSSGGQEGYVALRVKTAAEEIKELNRQEAVLIQEVGCQEVLV